MSEQDPEPARHDLLIVSKRRDMRVSPHGVKSLVRFLAAQAYIDRPSERVTDEWAEIEAGPGVGAHGAFHEGPSTGVDPVFERLVIGFGTAGRTFDHPDLAERVYFVLEIRGAAFEAVTDDLLERVHAVIYLRPELFARESVAAAVEARDGAAAEVGSRHAGTSVEEIGS